MICVKVPWSGKEAVEQKWLASEGQAGELWAMLPAAVTEDVASHCASSCMTRTAQESQQVPL